MTAQELTSQIERFQQVQQAQKQRGLNDYNPLTTVLKPHDEVRLHSRMIGSFLDVHGLHYQGSLFLQKFMECFRLQEFGMNVNNVKLALEYQNIDLYLTDGEKHLIIENKVYAKDQEHQIKRYIDHIKEKVSNPDDLLVIYLSIDRNEPSKYSLENLTIEDGYIKSGLEKTARYKSIHYNNKTNENILQWLTLCQNEIKNITNLNQACEYYINAIKQMLNAYTSSVLQLKDLFLEQDAYQSFSVNKNEVLIKFENPKDIENEFIEAKTMLIDKFYSRLFSRLWSDELIYKRFYENSTSGKEQDGDIVLMELFEYYELRIYIQKNHLASISVGINNDYNFIEESNKQYFLSKLDSIKPYITGQKKGERLAHTPIDEATIDNLFNEQLPPLDNDHLDELVSHINIIKQALKQ